MVSETKTCRPTVTSGNVVNKDIVATESDITPTPITSNDL